MKQLQRHCVHSLVKRHEGILRGRGRKINRDLKNYAASLVFPMRAGEVSRIVVFLEGNDCRRAGLGVSRSGWGNCPTGIDYVIRNSGSTHDGSSDVNLGKSPERTEIGKKLLQSESKLWIQSVLQLDISRGKKRCGVRISDSFLLVFISEISFGPGISPAS